VRFVCKKIFSIRDTEKNRNHNQHKKTFIFKNQTPTDIGDEYKRHNEKGEDSVDIISVPCEFDGFPPKTNIKQ
jgi:hypothetical protein